MRIRGPHSLSRGVWAYKLSLSLYWTHIPHIHHLKGLLTAGDDGAGSDLVHGRLGHKSTGEVEQGDKRQEDTEGFHYS